LLKKVLLFDLNKKEKIKYIIFFLFSFLYYIRIALNIKVTIYSIRILNIIFYIGVFYIRA